MKSPRRIASLLAGRILKVSQTAAAIPCLVYIIVCARLLTIGAAQTLPYTPTTIFIPDSKPRPAGENAAADVAYIFSPRADRVELVALNFSRTLQSASLPLETLSSNVPFLDTSSTAFTPSLADNGSLIVYAGDCSTPTGSGVWTFNPSPDDGASLTWTQARATHVASTPGARGGPGFLGGSLSFSTTLEPALSRATTYVYGGMCPNPPSSDSAASPQSQATYSNQMIKIEPSEAEPDGYDISPIASRGPPVPEAGFTLTGLTPSISNRSGVVTQQANYVLLGGHTQNAFVNMSTVAIWSLPEESWGFISDVRTAGTSPLAVKKSSTMARAQDSQPIDSRSGHTTVLSADGNSLVVLGGWVGDPSQAAAPQLAVLSIGDDYGGDGDWQWFVPSSQPEGPGIYGHGAALLPGNVMMVYGGYSVAATSGARVKGRQAANIPMFLNLTSMSWSSDYRNPGSTEGDQVDGDTTTAVGSTQQHLGLGLGLGLGLAAVAAVPVIFFCYRRRQRHRRTIRDSAIRALAQDTSQFLPHDDGDNDAAGYPGGPSKGASSVGWWYMGGGDPYARGGRSLGYQSLRTNIYGGPIQASPPMQQAGRRPLLRRGGYDPPSLSPASRGAAGGSGVIHPIIEADEDGGGAAASVPALAASEPSHSSSSPPDPFLTPTQESPTASLAPSLPPPAAAAGGRASQTPSPDRDPEVQEWMSDVDAVDALLSGAAARRAKATGVDDARTDSNVSESNRNRLSGQGGAVSRSGSGRSYALLSFFGGGSAPAPAPAPADDRAGTSSSTASVPSYNTARSSFSALQAEGPSLLMGRGPRNRDRDRDARREREEDGGGDDGNDDDDDGYDEPPGSPSKRKPRRSWLGSLRRALTGGSSSGAADNGDGGGGGNDDAARRAEGALAAGASDYEARLGGLSGIAAGGLLRRKSGRGDWEAPEAAGAGASGGRARGKGKATGARWSGGGGGGGDYRAVAGREAEGAPRYYDDNSQRRGGADEEEEEEWDIERAVETRLVQVMFTVPKEPLRVVNAEPDAESATGITIDEDDDDEEAGEEEQRRRQRESDGELRATAQAAADSTTVAEAVAAATAAREAEQLALREIGAELAAEAWRAPGRSKSRGRSAAPAARSRSRGRSLASEDGGARLSSATVDRLVDGGGASESRKRKPSHSPMASSTHSEGAVCSAQAVRLERAPAALRTRVLAMVENIEGRSREGSPGASAASLPLSAASGPR
ncbi:hypothetical protein GGS23DRAFT_602297 [Durotheca rogersii]|uniref:uncharacterized protein n=1 Tax=Durotheca rogersii TaxID=419775 RepID=UPI0022202421|nr:uncharacterized protein GGS23DRAFT_602297 [Durotheca rogersii]KAI5868549.1 hypothetical protein GGS23DRAFT_602297 [Durotheca rogersii]